MICFIIALAIKTRISTAWQQDPSLEITEQKEQLELNKCFHFNAINIYN